jgi:ATP/maltotriose-dependent transcriptional regulator MalT
MRLLVLLRTGELENWDDNAVVTIAEAMAVFEETGDHSGLAKGWRLLAWRHGTALRFANMAESFEHALEHARLAGDMKQAVQATTGYAGAASFGPTPAQEAIERCEDMLRQVAGDRHSEAAILGMLGGLHALVGSFEIAREYIGQALAVFEDLRLDVNFAHACVDAWRVEMLADELDAAERYLRLASDRLEAVGEKYLLSTVSGLLGQTLYAAGRFDEVETLARLSRELATDDDIDTQTLWRCLQGKVLAREGSAEEGEALVREAIEMLAATDAVLFQSDALVDLAEVQRIAGSGDVHATLTEARALAEAKEGPVVVANIDRLLASAGSSLV